MANNANDKGKMTYKGISRRWWPNWEGWAVVDYALEIGSGDIKQANDILKQDAWLDGKVVEFYKKNYWDKVHGDDMPSILAFNVCDYAVNSGPIDAIKCLQKCLGVGADGKIGPKTMGAIDCIVDLEQFIYDYNAERLDYLQTLDSWKWFGRGWTNRIEHNNELTAEALR